MAPTAALKKYERLVASVDGIVWEADARTFRFTFVSQQAERLLGHPLADWLAPGFWESHLHPDDRERTVQLCRRATMERRSHDVEYRMLARDGRTVWLRDIVSVGVEAGEPTSLRGVMVDISHTKQTEAALRKSEELYRFLTESSNDLVLLIDVEGRTVYASPSIGRQLGEVLTTWSIERVHPDDREAVRGAWQASLRGGTGAASFRYLADGGPRWLESTATLVRYAGQPHVLVIGRDITENRLAEEARRLHLWSFESLDRVNRATQGAGDLDQMLRDVLDAILAVFGCDRARLLHPCDPAAPTWRLAAERSRPGYAGAIPVGVDLPIDPGTAGSFRVVGEAAGPVRFDRGQAVDAPPEPAAGASASSSIALAIRPNNDRAYMLELHQCSYARVWTADEERLFESIGRRLADALTGFLVLRDLRESESRLEAAERIAHLGYWDIDVVADEVVGSDEAFRIMGIERGERPLTRAEARGHVVADDIDRLARAAAEASAGGPRFDIEYRILRPSGEVRVIHSQADILWDEAGKPRHIFGTMQDVTERRVAEDRLRASEARFRTFVDHATDAFLLHGPGGVILDANQQACDSLGYAREELIGQDAAMFDENRESSAELLHARLAAGQTVTFETRHRRKEGDVFPVEVRIRPFREGGRCFAVSLSRDISERKRAEEALRASENEFRATFELAAVGQAQADPATGKLVRVNRKLCELLGYSEEELLDREFAGITHPDDREREMALFRQMVRGEIPDFAIDKRMIRKDAAVVWMRITASLIRDADRRPLRSVAIAEDITLRKRAEDELRTSEARFRTFVDHATDAFFLHGADGTIIDVNRHACESLGYSRAELIGMTPAQIDAAGSPEFIARIADRLAAGELVAFDGFHRRKDGTMFPAEVRIRPFWLDGQQFAMSLARDVTERKRAERALVDSNRLLNAVIEGTSDAVFVKDQMGRYRLINSAGASALGKSVGEVLGKDDSEILTAPSAALVMARDRQVMTSGVSLTVEETGTAASAPRTYLSSKSALRDAQGNVTGVISIARDVTELKRLEEQFRQAQKMEAVGRLAGGVAHDFNNILMVINGNTDLVLDQLRGDEQARDLLAEIKRAGERAATLTRQLLAFSRKQVLQPQVVNLDALLGDLMKLLVRLIGEDVEVRLNAAADLGLARIDPGQFEQAIINLAINARDAMPGGGRLTIETSNVEVDPEYAAQHAEVKPGPYVRVSVTDSGVGMDQETRARVFEPFFTTKALGDGTGLGLAMMYGFVKQSGGHVEVHSEPGAGTTFRLYLPRAEGERASPRAARESPDVAGGHETILLVEDEDSVRNLVMQVLHRMGYTVLAAKDADEAFSVARSHAGQIDLVLTDVIMPRMSGAELAAGLAKLRPAARILFMSGYTDEAVMRHGIQQPGLAFLNKPFTATALAAKVRELLDAR